MKIVFLDGYTLFGDGVSDAPLRALGHVTIYDRTEPADVVARAADAEILLVNKTRLSADTLAHLPALRLVCVAATGYDRVDVAAAARLGITVCNCAGYSTQSVAQLTASLILEGVDRVGEYAASTRRGDWSEQTDFSYTLWPRLELEGKLMAVVGMGHIGRAVARVMRPFGLRFVCVSGCDPSLLPDDVTPVSLEEAFRTAQIVSLNCPLRSDNYHMVDDSLLSLCSPSLVLVNTARGALVDEQAVARTLHEGRLGAYLTDVLEQAPPSPDCPLFSAPRAYVTPHIGWATVEARTRIVCILADNISAFLSGSPRNVVSA